MGFCRPILRSLRLLDCISSLHSFCSIPRRITEYLNTIIMYNKKAVQYYKKGLVLNEQGNLTAAERSYKKAIKINKEFAEAHNNLGNVLMSQGRYKEAEMSYREALRLLPNHAMVLSNTGHSLQQQGKNEDAIFWLRKAIKADPMYADAHNNLGNAMHELGRLDDAAASYNKAIIINPNLYKAYTNLGATQKEIGKYKEAIDSYGEAIRIRSDYAEAYNNRGNALQDLGQLKDAIADYDKAIQFRPDYAGAYNNRSNALKDLGQLKEALAGYDKAIQFRPDYAEAHRNLSTIKQYSPGDNQIVVMEELFSEDRLKEPDRMQLSFALAKAYEDLGDYDRSFNYLAEGNCLRKKELKYTIDKDRRLFVIIRNIFDAGQQPLDFVPNVESTKHPIFIVGMPRSGTSLVEQILASHSEVHGAGELETMSQLVRPILHSLEQKKSQHNYQVSQNEIKAVHEGYINMLTALKIYERVITDKMPLNFRWIGFILSAFPEATIVHLNRDPRATCWSIYKHYFSSKGNGYAYDIDDLAEYYKLYTDLMSFWRERFPDRIYDLCYEDLTEHQEEETRKLLQCCGLEWEEQCLNFHEIKRAVKTASATQVRKKMYKGSSEAWRKYEQQLQLLITNLSMTNK